MQYNLKQTVIVTEKNLETNNTNNGVLHTSIGATFFFGDIAAINGHQLCIRRYNVNFSLDTDITELQWINLNTENYCVTPITLAYPQKTS